MLIIIISTDNLLNKRILQVVDSSKIAPVLLTFIATVCVCQSRSGQLRCDGNTELDKKKNILCGLLPVDKFYNHLSTKMTFPSKTPERLYSPTCQ